MTLNLKKVTRIYRTCIVCLLCTCLCSIAQAGVKNVFKIQGTEVPEPVMNVMTYCAETWSQYISTSIPIQVSVSWQELKSNVNAYAKPTNYYSIDNIFYPVALAEKIQGKNLNGNNADIEVVINKSINWNLSTDNPSEEKQYDLITTLLHELAHGLGLIGNITAECLDSKEFPSPTIYDMFISDSTYQKIVYSENNTYYIKNELLNSNKLFWNGQFTKAVCGEFLQLYAPTNFNSGSTAYHLDETTYPTGSGFELMTPVLRSTEIFREPDAATIAMLADIGWNSYYCTVFQPTNNSNLADETVISYYLDVTFLEKIQKSSVLYSLDSGKHAIELLPTADENIFTTNIPSLPFDHTISYAIQLITTSNDTIVLPTKNDWYSVFIGDDSEAPRIEHTPLTSTQKIDIQIEASITDNFGIDSAYVQYFVERNQELIQDTIRTNFEFDVLATHSLIQLSAINQPFKAGDEIFYNITAVDYSGNTAYTDFYKIVLEEAQEPVHYFMTDFDDENSADFFTLDKCTISKEDGFANNALHTAHPYAYTGIDGKYNQYIATLKTPIVIASNPATMSFDEVVLVEPGKAGIEYGTFGFWDYVIVEGSKDINAETWYPLGKIGWDSQLFGEWKTRYYSSTKNDGDNENSLAVGDSTLFRKHTINLLENKYFRTGDTVYVRFRLQSDATNYAWGWAIDNLKIQERISLQTTTIENTQTIFPNPCTDMLYFTDNDFKQATIYDQTGKSVLTATKAPINVSHLKRGTYSILIENHNNTRQTQLFIKQ